MSTLLNVLLLVVGTVATLAAFGGETWNKGTTPLVKRITRRGWISLGCLLGALILGVTKEILDSNEKATLKTESDIAASQLTSANEELARLQTDLAATRTQLSKQAQVNLVTVLSSGSPIKRVAWWVEPIKSGADEFQVLFSHIPDAYRDIAQARIYFNSFLGSKTVVQLVYEDGTLQRSFPNAKRGKSFVEPKISVPGGDNHVYSIFQDVAPTEEIRNAAIGYRDLAERNSYVELSLHFAKKFSTEEELRAYLKDHPNLSTTSTWHDEVGKFWAAEFSIPPDVTTQVLNHWHTEIRKSMVILYLDSSAHLMIQSPMRAELASTGTAKISIRFVPASSPEIIVGIQEF